MFCWFCLPPPVGAMTLGRAIVRPAAIPGFSNFSRAFCYQRLGVHESPNNRPWSSPPIPGERPFKTRFGRFLHQQDSWPRFLSNSRRHPIVVTKGQWRITFGACTLARKLVRLFLEFSFTTDAVSASPSAPSSAVFGHGRGL